MTTSRSVVQARALLDTKDLSRVQLKNDNAGFRHQVGRSTSPHDRSSRLGHIGHKEQQTQVTVRQVHHGDSAYEEKRIVVQNFVHFQQVSRPGAKGNMFARIPNEPRCKAACVLCQRKDFIQHQPAGSSPRPRPQTCVRSPPVDPSCVGVPHDSPTTRPHREGCNSGTAFVQGLKRLQSGHSGKGRTGHQRGWTPG